jgi:dihydropteroate synthase
MYWQTSRFAIDLQKPVVMGIVNVTPDSFSDGGQFIGTPAALRRCEELLKDGAGILDIGGESSRPGAPALSLQEELDRVLPVVRGAVTLGVPVSVDTYKPEVMQAVLDLGADIINDIWALRQPGAVEVVATHASCGVCVMHMHRDPQSMQVEPMQGDVPLQVKQFLVDRVHVLTAAGIQRSRISVDPGIGFGKTVAQNFALLEHQGIFGALDCPVLAGWSRKSSLAAAVSPSLDQAAALQMQDRVLPSVVSAVLAVERGARVVRVHDVRETVIALKVWSAMKTTVNLDEKGN